MRTLLLLSSTLLIALFTGLGTNELQLLGQEVSTTNTLTQIGSSSSFIFGIAYLACGLGGMLALYRRSIAGMLLACGSGAGLYLFQNLIATV